MQEIAEAFKAIFAKIGDFFDIFDLSFFISGAAVLGSLVWAAGLAHVARPPLLSGGLGLLIIVVACYLIGLIFFAMGRYLRKGRKGKKSEKEFNRLFTNVLAAHGLENTEPYKSYLLRNDDDLRAKWRLYIRLWAEVRQTPELAPSFALLRRYWVLAAAYDGLGCALLSWLLILILWACNLFATPAPALPLTIITALLLLLASAACFREADRHTTYQVEDAVASIAVQMTKATNAPGVFDKSVNKDPEKKIENR